MNAEISGNFKIVVLHYFYAEDNSMAN